MRFTKSNYQIESYKDEILNSIYLMSWSTDITLQLKLYSEVVIYINICI